MTSSTMSAPEPIGSPPAGKPPRGPLAAGLRLLPRRGRPSPLDVIREYGIVMVFLALFVVLCFSSDVFLTERNLLAILEQNAPVGIVAVATTLCFICGGFDLSVGATFAFAGMVAAALAVAGVSPALSLLTGVAAGFGVGLLNGLVTSLARINPFVTTLAASIVVGGLATIVHDGSIISVAGEGFGKLGNGLALGVPYSVWIWLGVTLACGFALQRTVFGRYVYAIGGSDEAARLSGVRVIWVRTACYVISGAGAALAGVIVASHVSAGQSNAGGIDLAVTAIAAVVVGGTSLAGGEGAIWRTILGVLLLALIGNGFDLLGVNPNYQSIFRGGLIVIAVGVDTLARRRPR